MTPLRHCERAFQRRSYLLASALWHLLRVVRPLQVPESIRNCRCSWWVQRWWHGRIPKAHCPSGLGHPSKIKWLLTSRPLDSAERALLAGGHQVLVSLDLNSKTCSWSCKGLHRCSSGWARSSPEIWTSTTSERRGRTHCKSWGHLFVGELGVQESRERVPGRGIIDNSWLATGVVSFLSSDIWSLSKGESAVVDGCMRLLKVMLLVYRPLKAEEVNSVTESFDEDFAIEALVDRCASFVKKHGTDIVFVHQSARDYLGGKNGKSVLDSHEQYSHGEITPSYPSYLSGRLKVNHVQAYRLARIPVQKTWRMYRCQSSITATEMHSFCEVANL